MDTIDEFNEEEELFGWELSQYPLRKAVSLTVLSILPNLKQQKLYSNKFCIII